MSGNGHQRVNNVMEESSRSGYYGHAPLSVHTILSLPQYHGLARETSGHIR